MNYYKLINGSEFIGVATQHDFRVYQKKHSLLLACDEQIAQYVQFGSTLYHAGWMSPVVTDVFAYETVDVLRIDKEEYDILYKAIDSGEEVVIQPEQDVFEEAPVPVDPSELATVDYVQRAKIAEMNVACNAAIEGGIDVMLNDGVVRHFSLTTQDQLNLITLQSMIAAGETQIPYHADGELCRYYSVEDITAVMDAATAHKTFHVTYFNSLKVYVNALDNIYDISAIQYGTIIPDEYQSDILKAICASMAVTNNEENN